MLIIATYSVSHHSCSTEHVAVYVIILDCMELNCSIFDNILQIYICVCL